MIKQLLLTLLAGPAAASAQGGAPSSPAEAAVLRQIEAQRATDALIGAKIGSRQVLERMLAAMTGARGVHIESLLCALGSLAGYACQASVRAIAVSSGLAATALLVQARTTDGRTFYFGDELNRPLAEGRHSVWSLAVAGAESAGCRSVPAPGAIFTHVSRTVGTPAFGVPRLPAGHPVHDAPVNYVRTFWPALAPSIRTYCPDPLHWPILLGLSIQGTIVDGKQALDPCLALQIVMESAVPMSKIDLS